MSTKTENKPKNGNQITLLGLRLSHPKLTEAKAVEEGGAKRYGCELWIEKTPEGKKEYEKANALIQGIKSSKEKDDRKVKIHKSNICLQDGDDENWERRRPEHAGHWVLSANRAESQDRPRALGKKKSAGDLSIEETRKLFYPGCYVNVVVSPFYTAKGGGHKIANVLEVIQFVRDGERLGAGGEANIDDLPDIDDDEDLSDEDEADPAADM